jgi:hypothetical protein
MPKGWDRRAAAVLLICVVGTLGWTGSARATQKRTAPSRATSQATHQASPGITGTALSFFNQLMEKVLAAVTPHPTPNSHNPGMGPLDDNGAGIDPNGSH